MAVTIVRTPWIDDDGSGTTGTVLNNAIKTELYNQIDGALAQLVSGSNGLLNITAFGTNSISAAGTGGNLLNVANTTDGAGNYCHVSAKAGTGASAGETTLRAYPPSYTAVSSQVPGGSELLATGPGGLTLTALHGTGAIRFYTTAGEQMRVLPDGRILMGRTSALGPGHLQILADPNVQWGIGISPTVDLAGGAFVGFTNAAGTAQGTITAVNPTTTAYNTTSDQRLKEDLGVADDLTALRAVVVHDFIWPAHGGHDRGVFAQETFPVFPRAVTVGTPGDDLSKPWATDYAKFVPDLIVGWQEHDRRLARLEQLAVLASGDR